MRRRSCAWIKFSGRNKMQKPSGRELFRRVFCACAFVQCRIVCRDALRREPAPGVGLSVGLLHADRSRRDERNDRERSSRADSAACAGVGVGLAGLGGAVRVVGSGGGDLDVGDQQISELVALCDVEHGAAVLEVALADFNIALAVIRVVEVDGLCFVGRVISEFGGDLRGDGNSGVGLQGLLGEKVEAYICALGFE